MDTLKPLVEKIEKWREDDKGGYDQAIDLLCEAESVLKGLAESPRHSGANRKIHLVCRSFNQIAYVVGDEDRQRTLTLSTPEDASKVWSMIASAFYTAPPHTDPPVGERQ